MHQYHDLLRRILDAGDGGHGDLDSGPPPGFAHQGRGAENLLYGALVSLVQGLPLPALLIGPEARNGVVSSGIGELLGEGLTGRHYMTVLRQPAMLDAVEEAARTGARRETRYLGNDGSSDTTYLVHCSPVEMEGGRGVLVSFNDITHLEQASQIRRDFVANVSHELRSPLTALMGFIETLQGPARGDPEAAERFLGIMQREAARMERLVRDLLSLSRVEAQQRVRPSAQVNLGELVQSVIYAVSPLAAQRAVRLDLRAPDTPVILAGDADQLRQVVTNLIENAIKYGGPDQVVEISLERATHEPLLRAPAALLRVRDHGPGFDPVHIPRLTERFYRVDNHRSREMGGTGLGLAIVKHILNRHRGRLRVWSEIGKGSEFCVILPL